MKSVSDNNNYEVGMIKRDKSQFSWRSWIQTLTSWEKPFCICNEGIYNGTVKICCCHVHPKGEKNNNNRDIAIIIFKGKTIYKAKL